MNRVGLLGSVVLVLLTTIQAVEAQTLRVDFEAATDGAINQRGLSQLWPNLEWASVERTRVVADSDTQRGRVLRVAYPQGSVGPNQGGAQFLVKLPAAEEYWLTYRVKFETGFDFKRGGKLPGLTSGGSKYTGGTKPTAGDGWSARYMWGPEGTAKVYLYYVDMPGEYGQDLPLKDVKFVPGTWHTLTQQIRVNSVNDNNGILNVWCDLTLVFSATNIRYRIGDQGPIDSFYFSTFHGGSTNDWAPGNDCFACFDDFVISSVPPGELKPEPAATVGAGDRSWTLVNGAVLQGRILEINPRTQTVQFRRSDGSILRALPLKRFREEDRQTILELGNTDGKPAK